MTAGHLGAYKTLEKIRQRYYWRGFKTDVKHHILRCDKCQKRSGPPQKHRHSLVDRKISYSFQHIGLDFLGPLPTSNGCCYILLIGDHFTKWYEANPIPDQTAATTSDVPLERWICRFGCWYSIHTDRGTNFESQLFANLQGKLEIDKTRTIAFPPQSNSVIERMNRILLNMLAKCIDEDQTNWSVKLPYVLMAYRSSVHESTGFTPHYLVFGHEISLPLDRMYRPPPSATPTDAIIGSRRKKKPSARLMSLFDAMILFNNAVAIICTMNVYVASHTKTANTFFSITPLFNVEKIQNFPVLGEAPTKF